MIGTTRSRVSLFLDRFRKLGFIDYHGGDDLRVHSSLLTSFSTTSSAPKSGPPHDVFGFAICEVAKKSSQDWAVWISRVMLT